MTDEALPAAWAANLAQVAVIGAGTMGEGIAQSFAEAGFYVHILDLKAAAIERCLAQIRQNLQLAASFGMDTEPVETVMARITSTATPHPAQNVNSAQLIVETVPEIRELKMALFSALDALPEDTLIGSNTSSMTISSLTKGMVTAHRVVGLHYFNPAHILPTVEIHAGEATSKLSINRARAILERCGKSPLVVLKEMPGFVINRLTGALMREIGFLLDEGVVSPQDLDAGVRGTLGIRLPWIGPMEGSDFTGLDIGARVQTNLFPTLSNRTYPSEQLLAKVAAGELGLKAQKGWYDYAGKDQAEVLKARNIDLLLQLKAFRTQRSARQKEEKT